jgi:D-glucuronyl C5-epimerase C-terminus
VRRRLFGLVLLAIFPSTAAAAPVAVLGAGGHVSHRNDPFLRLPALTPAPLRGAAVTQTPPRSATQASAARARPRPRRAQRTVLSELARLLGSHAITPAEYGACRASFNAALAAVRRLRGTRAAELESVVENLHGIAAAGLLTPSRLPALFETLDRNRQWWTTGPLLSSGDRVEFTGSQLVWEYYPGQGIELQVLGSFGKADGLYTAGASQYPALRALLAELIPLAAQRGGGLTWEYYFHFDGGSPPWTSAMSQGTALEALTRAYEAFGESSYLTLAQQALPIFEATPAVGVRETTPVGSRYLQYSFAPGADIINAFLQSLIGLYDYVRVSGSQLAGHLFAAGDAQARAELPQFDTGAWSLYQPGIEDSLDYHLLVTGFLQQLCARTQQPAYCVTAQHYQAYLKTPPALALLTHRVRRGAPAVVRFRLSKYSHVGIVLVHGSQTVFLTSAWFGYGAAAFAIPPLARRGQYTVRLAATDLAGNFNRTVGTLNVY